MECWRTARDSGLPFTHQDQMELDALIEAELKASADRAVALADQLGK